MDLSIQDFNDFLPTQHFAFQEVLQGNAFLFMLSDEVVFQGFLAHQAVMAAPLLQQVRDFAAFTLSTDLALCIFPPT